MNDRDINSNDNHNNNTNNNNPFALPPTNLFTCTSPFSSVDCSITTSEPASTPFSGFDVKSFNTFVKGSESQQTTTTTTNVNPFEFTLTTNPLVLFQPPSQ
eukprot:UN09830